jgi:sugar (pentulose or hexulose) kinase
MFVTARDPGGIVVLDVGSTKVQATLFDGELNLLAEETIRSNRREGPPYLSIDLEPVLAFAGRVLPRFDSVLPVEAIVPCSHGSAVALVDSAGELVLPIMSYEANPPQVVVDGYAAIAPAFSEVFAPTNPLALTLARQFYWQETRFPEAFAKASAIMPLAQYLAFRLCGIQANEVSAMGAQTHLWAPLTRDYTQLAKRRGWAALFPPIRSAWDALGRVVNIPMRGPAMVLTGVHDSNANLVPYLGGDRFTLLSTGTWIIGFTQGVGLTELDPTRDQVSNTTVFADPIASFRFMGGREFDVVADGAPPRLASRECVIELLDRGVRAWPSFTTSGGPVPNSGGKGYIEGVVGDARERASLASLYCAQMTALAVRESGPVNRVIVDGPFVENDVFLEVLAACLPDRPIFASAIKSGTAVGAATLALMTKGNRNTAPRMSARRIVAPPELIENAGLASWFHQVDSLS